MKAKVVLFIIWMVLTFLMCVSLVGLLLLMSHKDTFKYQNTVITRSAWMEMGIKLIDSILKN